MQITQCKHCGARSLPLFGYPRSCRADSLGRHRDLVSVDEPESVTRERLQRQMEFASGADWARLYRGQSASAAEARRLLGI